MTRPNPETSNQGDASTRNLAETEFKPPAFTASPKPKTGRRAWQPLYLWEGEVQQVTDQGFTARLVPYENGHPNPSRLEFADFEFADVSDDEDLALVAVGAVFYWSVGRARNWAGTKQNASLLRFRRLPRPSARIKARLALEAEALLRDLTTGT